VCSGHGICAFKEMPIDRLSWPKIGFNPKARLSDFSFHET
jgi:hypothetical protein